MIRTNLKGIKSIYRIAHLIFFHPSNEMELSGMLIAERQIARKTTKVNEKQQSFSGQLPQP